MDTQTTNPRHEKAVKVLNRDLPNNTRHSPHTEDIADARVRRYKKLMDMSDEQWRAITRGL